VMRDKCGKLTGDPNGAPRYRKYCFKQRGSDMVNAWTKAETSGKVIYNYLILV
jgi:hypothetical protein